jgi:hypothetical protein
MGADVSTDSDLEPAPGDAPARGRRPVWAWLATGLAGLLVVFALNLPNEIDRLTPAAFVRIPVEGLVGVALLLAVPGRARRAVAATAGAALGALTIMKLVDMGFYAVLDRPFDLVADWPLLDAAWSFVAESYGQLGALLAVLAAAVLGIAVVVLTTGAVVRLTRQAAQHRTAAFGGAGALGVAAVAFAVLGVQVVPDVPIASLTYDHLRQAAATFQDRREFAEAIADDAFRDTPAEQLLTGLRGKDVVVAMVESYGRDVVEEPELGAEVTALLDAGTGRLRAAGFESRSAFLTSPTAGGASWLAHATLLSGLWIDDQQRYGTLVSSDRLTLGSAFRRAGWRTAGVMPGVRWEWPQGSSFFGYDRIYGAENVGYRGPRFKWAAMPDQYALSVLQRAERAGPSPVMAEVAMVSSHVPWTAIPPLVGWDEVGDGTVFGTTAEAPTADISWSDRNQVRGAYEDAIAYSLSTLISYVETYGDEDLVLVFLGDHQPAPMITGSGASRDVPVTIVAGDQAVLDQVAGWGWDDGLRPGPQAPVWRMDAFRDRFLTAFGPPAAPPPGSPER